MVKYCICLVAVVLSAVGSLPCFGFADDAVKTKVDGQRVFYASHSLMWYVPDQLAEFASARDIEGHRLIGLQKMGASRTLQHWELPANANEAKKALEQGNVDVFVMSPIQFPDEGIEKFIQLGLKHNPEMRFLVQLSWGGGDIDNQDFPKGAWEVPDRNKSPEQLSQMNARNIQAGEAQVDFLNKTYGNGQDIVFLIPTSQAVSELRSRIYRKEISGLNSQDELFVDPAHPSAPLEALNSYLHYAVLYRQSPIGLPATQKLDQFGKQEWDETFIRTLQEIAWKTAQNYPRAGLENRKPQYDGLSGDWKVDFDTQIGVQSYVITFGGEDGSLSATAKAEVNGRSRDVVFEQVKRSGETISFVEKLNFGGNEIRIEYEGKIGNDTIVFTRKVGEFATEEATAKKSGSVDRLMSENAKDAMKGGAVAQRQQAVAMGGSVDPNFQIYLCFGQSNMDSGGRMNDADRDVPERLLVMADFDNEDRGWQKGRWYHGIPPLAARGRGICMVDSFGKAMVNSLPDDVRVGIIKVCVPGCKIELFQPESYQSYIDGERDWMKNIVKDYQGNPYQYLVDMAKEAQKHGVIKGILLHQGESNTGDKEWPLKVKSVYDHLMQDLDLDPRDVPLLAGEMVHADQEGRCASHNAIIATLPETIPGARVISSAGLPTDDKLHFNPEGSRQFGRRYAEAMLSQLLASENSTSAPVQEMPASQQSKEKLTGTWHCQFESPFGMQTYHLQIAINEAGEATATAEVEARGEVRKVEFVEVKVGDDSLSFVEVRQFGDRELRIEYSGERKAENLAITRSFGERGGQESLATRELPKPAPQEDPAPVVKVKIDHLIKDVFKDSFLIGMAGDLPSRYSDQELGIASEHFAAITPENCMKPERVHPAEDRWNFQQTDALVAWAQQNGMTIHGHTLVWHAQTPNWFFEGRDRETIKQRMQQHIETLAGRYKGKLQSWDVVNEAINDGGNSETAKTENLRNSQWLQTLGPEFLTLAFQFARQADPEAVLYYNDYNIESGPKHASSMVLLKRLLAEGAPIDAVGIQGHWRSGRVPFDDIEKAITDYASLGLKVSITELDVTIRGESGGQFGQRRFRNSAPPSIEDLNAQADDYAKLFAIFKKHEDVIERVTFWGLNDRRTWRWGQHPLLFDGNNHPKPAYASIVSLSVANPTETKTSEDK